MKFWGVVEDEFRFVELEKSIFFRKLFLAPLAREISWGNNVVIMENAKMICNGQKNLEKIAYSNYIISINTA